MDSYLSFNPHGSDDPAGRSWADSTRSPMFLPSLGLSLQPAMVAPTIDLLRSAALSARWVQGLQPRGTDAAPAPGSALSGVARFVGWTADLFRRHLVDPEGSIVALPAAEFMVLLAFLGNPRRVLSRDQLARRALGHPIERGARTLDVYVSRLRGRLRDEPPAQRLISTVRNSGYMLDADVIFESGA